MCAATARGGESRTGLLGRTARLAATAVKTDLEKSPMSSTHLVPLDLCSAADLVAEDLPPIYMVVGSIIPAGLLLLAGDPKAGKSLVMMSLAVAITSGDPAWGAYPVDAGDVLYLSYEGGRISFRDRLIKMLGGAPGPTRLKIGTASARLTEGLEEQIEAWLSTADDPRLVVIDTYTAVAPETRGSNRLREDYATLAGLAELCTRWPKTLVVVVHHTRKSEGDSAVMQKISGSQGLTAVTDGNAVLRRHTAARQCVLHIRPRNAEDPRSCWSATTTPCASTSWATTSAPSSPPPARPSSPGWTPTPTGVSRRPSQPTCSSPRTASASSYPRWPPTASSPSPGAAGTPPSRGPASRRPRSTNDPAAQLESSGLRRPGLGVPGGFLSGPEPDVNLGLRAGPLLTR